MTLSVRQVAGAFPALHRSRRQEVAIYAFTTALLLLLVTAIGLAFQYTLPAPNGVQLGSLADFPPSATPYRIARQHPIVYVVNAGEELQILASQDPHRWGCRILWDRSNHRFDDPCLGSKYALDGIYILGPSPRGMDHYAYRIINGNVWADVTKKMLGDRCSAYAYDGDHDFANLSKKLINRCINQP